MTTPTTSPTPIQEDKIDILVPAGLEPWSITDFAIGIS